MKRVSLMRGLTLLNKVHKFLTSARILSKKSPGLRQF